MSYLTEEEIEELMEIVNKNNFEEINNLIYELENPLVIEDFKSPKVKYNFLKLKEKTDKVKTFLEYIDINPLYLEDTIKRIFKDLKRETNISITNFEGYFFHYGNLILFIPKDSMKIIEKNFKIIPNQLLQKINNKLSELLGINKKGNLCKSSEYKILEKTTIPIIKLKNNEYFIEFYILER